MHPASFRSAVIVGGGSYGSGSPESGSLWRILVWKFSNPQEPQQPERMGRVRHGHHLPLVWTDNGLRWTLWRHRFGDGPEFASHRRHHNCSREGEVTYYPVWPPSSRIAWGESRHSLTFY